MRAFRALGFLLLLACSCLGYGTNLIPNSSFEVGPGRGWIQVKTTSSDFFGNREFPNERLTNDAVNGGFALINYVASPNYSRAFYVTNTGWHCLSWYQKTALGSSFGGTYAFVTSYSNNVFLDQPTHVPSGTMTRVSTNVNIAYPGYYKAQISCNGGTAILIDAVQFEEGESPTPYSPSSQVECGIRVGGTYGRWFLGDTPTFEMRFRNEGAVTNVAAEYKLFDYKHSNYLTHRFYIGCAAATNTVTNVAIPRFGWTKMYTRLLAIPDSWDEGTTIWYNYPSNRTVTFEADWLGGHPYPGLYHTLVEYLAGRTMGRTLSPGSFNTRWWDNIGSGFKGIENTRGVLEYFPASRGVGLNDRDYSYTNWFTVGLIGLGVHTAQDGFWPPWAVVANAPGQTYHTNAFFPYIGMWDGMAWSNYNYFTTLTNKLAVRVVEPCPNESYNQGPDNGPPTPVDGNLFIGGDNLPINVKNPTNYVKVFAYAVMGITNADPTVKIVFGSGAAGNGDWVWSCWTNLNNLYPAIVPWVYAVSNHRYQNDIGADPNLPYYIGQGSHYPQGWMDKFKGLKPVWNTENNTGGSHYTRGINGLHSMDLATDFEAVGDESVRWEESNRQLWQLDTDLSGVIRDIGFGYHKTFWYDCRDNDVASMNMMPNSATTYPTDLFGIDKPVMVARSVARYMFDAPGYGAISNSVMPLEMYMFTNATRGWSVAAALSADKTNRIVTLTNSVAVIDCMGNTLGTNTTTFIVKRTPVYVISRTLTVQVLSNSLKYAASYVTNDTTAPNVSIDIAPTGLWDGRTNQALLKWSGLDDTVVQFPGSANTTNVLFSYKLNGTSYSTPSQSNHVWLDHIPAGTNTFWVKAWDKSGNENEVSYDFFPFVPIAPPANLHVIGTFNVGTIGIVQ